MGKCRKIFDRIFIDGLSGMAQGLFATLIIGTIIQQIGTLIGGSIGDMIFVIGKVAASLTGAGIGIGVAYKFGCSQLVVVSSATAGMVGAFASKLLAGTVLVEGTMVYAGPGEPLGAFLAAYIGIELGQLVTGKTKIDILVTPLVGNRTTAIYYGYRSISIDGNDPDAADQFRSTRYYPESVRSGSRSCNCRLLLQYGRICSGKLS